MRVLCRHGHFAFYPQAADDVQRFQRLFKLVLYPEADYFTVLGLLGLPRWSQIGRLFGTLPAVATVEGRHASEVMKANGFVYSLGLGTLVPLAAVSGSLTLQQGRDYILAPKPLVQPGSLVMGGAASLVMVGYQGQIDMGQQRLYIDTLETLS